MEDGLDELLNQIVGMLWNAGAEGKSVRRIALGWREYGLLARYIVWRSDADIIDSISDLKFNDVPVRMVGTESACSLDY